jgi:hypothetical protein
MAGTAGEIEITSLTTGVSYNIDYDRLVWDLLPKRYRQIKLYRYLQCIMYSLRRFWFNNFLVYREKSLREIRINSQTIVLQKWLNYLFGRNDIQIVNISFIAEPVYIYRKGEIGDATNDNTYTFNIAEAGTAGLGDDHVYIYRRTETEVSYDFKVRVPLALFTTGITEQQIKSIIDRYVALGVTYIIETF